MVSRAERMVSADWCGLLPQEASGLYALREDLRRKGERLKILKCQSIGPLTLISFSKKLDGDWFGKIRRATEIVLKGIEWQRMFFRDCCGDLLFVLDEPALGMWGELDKEQRTALRESYSYLYVRIAEAGGFLGLHCCGRFNPEFLCLPAELLSFDAMKVSMEDLTAENTRDLWREAGRRGVVLAPGVFPAAGGSSDECKKGYELSAEFRAALARIAGYNDRQILLAANCGHANASPAWLELIYSSVPR